MLMPLYLAWLLVLIFFYTLPCACCATLTVMKDSLFPSPSRTDSRSSACSFHARGNRNQVSSLPQHQLK